MLRRLTYTLSFCFAAAFAGAQEPGADDATILYRNEAVGGLVFHSQGWGISFRRGVNLTGYLKRMTEIEYVGIKHPKETKSVNPYYENAKSYIYGKVNTFSILRAGIGRQKVIAGKDGRNGIELRWVAYGGASLGLAKPVYLNVVVEEDTVYGYVATERYDPQKHFPHNIYGRAPFTKGLGELRLHPGLYGKLGLSFEYGSLQEDVKVIETGFGFDFYTHEIPIMAPDFARNNQYFLTFYINLLYGARW